MANFELSAKSLPQLSKNKIDDLRPVQNQSHSAMKFSNMIRQALPKPSSRPKNRPAFQLGGTILGFIMGVVFGLAAALAVAVYVAKVPSPFVNKGQSRSAEQDATEAKKNKDWDPNAPLYGKNPAKPAPAASHAAAPASDAAAASTQPVAPAVAGGPGTAVKPEPKPDAGKTDNSKANPPAPSPAPSPPAATNPMSSADPLGDLARSRSSNSVAEPFVYFVQVGAYRNAEDAESQRAKLSLTGVEARVTEREQSGRAIFRVRVGPFDKKDDAERSKEKLDGAGLDTALVRVQR